MRQVISKLNLSRFGVVRDGVGALIMGFAVTAMHYTAMASTYCFATPGPARTAVDHSVFAGVTALIASLVLLLTIVAVMFDRRVAQEASSHRRTSEQLMQAQKMEAVGQLTGGVAHDFNNILTIVLANADAILDDDGVPPHITKRAQRISDAGQKASELTRQLLAFSRKQVLKPEISDLNDLVASTGKLLRRTLGEHIERADHRRPQPLADLRRPSAGRDRADQPLHQRARRHAGGRPPHRRDPQRHAVLGLRRAAGGRGRAGRVRHAVGQRHRSGMPPDIRRRVFEPFFTTKEVGKGTGLGLSMVYGFIRQSNGHIEITSEVGRGTTVRMYFPRSDPATAAAPAPRRQAMPRGSERILVVEDEKAVRAIVGEQLGSLGYDVEARQGCRPGARAPEGQSLRTRADRRRHAGPAERPRARRGGQAGLARHAHRLHVGLFGERAAARRPPRKRRDASRQAARQSRPRQDHPRRARRQPDATASAPLSTARRSKGGNPR